MSRYGLFQGLSPRPPPRAGRVLVVLRTGTGGLDIPGRNFYQRAAITARAPAQRRTRAEPPLARATTSSRVAIEVSPGVVMASAP